MRESQKGFEHLKDCEMVHVEKGGRRNMRYGEFEIILVVTQKPTSMSIMSYSKYVLHFFYQRTVAFPK
jgi:hypothetical protein